MFARRGMRAGMAQSEVISRVLFNMYLKDMPVTSHHVELALYVNMT